VAKIADWDDHIGRRLRLRDLRVFFAVTQSGSLTKAAAHLRVSHPAVSQVIANLEQVLGVKLFDRSSRGVEPTIYAHALLARGRAAFDELRQGIRDIGFLADPTTGELTIGYAQSIADTMLPQIVEQFSRDHPRVVMHANIVPPRNQRFHQQTVRPVAATMRRVASALANALSAGDTAAAAALFATDAAFDDLTLHTSVVGQPAIRGFLDRSRGLLPYGLGTSIRHAVGSAQGGGYEWLKKGALVDHGVIALELDSRALITHLTAVWDGSLVDTATLTALLATTVEQ